MSRERQVEEPGLHVDASRPPAAAYHVCRLRVAAEREDELAAEACSRGAVGAWVREHEPPVVLLEVYFPAAVAALQVARFLENATESGARPLGAAGLSVMEDRDWLEEYRRSARPVRIGPLELDPREPEDGGAAPRAPSDGGIVLRLPARRAFGTGSHASTRLVLEELLEMRHALRGGAVLDVGCGTGVLSFAALALGARTALALDVDARAVGQASANRRLNRLEPMLLAGSVHALESEASFDMALVNVIPEQLESDHARIVRLVRPGGLVVASGILTERGDSAVVPWLAAGLRERRRRWADEWVAMVLERPGSKNGADSSGERAPGEDVRS
jgi:ribosomal protein L11 methyltransferase